ncbi:MAG TPA: ATPase, T2SS/T4P/T4SS family [Candidatus Gastranaerophilales bacterium]|nr:ATPase, T2SS/T4P/T4SS family [Candidatus Gastranaerophilales bacterium]
MPNYVSNKTIEKLKYDLVRNNLISYENLAQAEEISRKTTRNLGQTIIEEKFISEEDILKFLQDNLGIPYVDLKDYSLDEKCLSFISVEDAKKYKILPLFRIENVLTVAMADPLDLFVINNLVKCVKCDIEPIICSERLILEFIEKYYLKPENKNAGCKECVNRDWREELDEEFPDINHAEKIINSIIIQALRENAFEVIFENNRGALKVKFRKSSVIEHKGDIPVLLSSLCVSHIKIISGLDPSVTSFPQLGKFNFADDLDDVTAIISCFPCNSDERIVIKLYSPPKTVQELPIPDDYKDIILKSLEKPGIILILGEELSGKSFLAYTLLNSVDSENKNVMTVESIVKYNLQGINQCELNEKIGFSAKKALKYIDFNTPDIVYVEEILSGKLTEYVLNLAKSGKIVITEVNSATFEGMKEIFTPDELKAFQNHLNCVINVKKLNDISVIPIQISFR